MFLVNLSALVYQHSVTPLALPIKLVLPVADMTEDYRSMANPQQQPQQHEVTKKLSVKDLLEKGAGKNLSNSNNSFISLTISLSLQCYLFK